MPCPKCNSYDVIPNVKILDHRNLGAPPDSLEVEFEANPTALFFRDRHHGTLQANICGQCGFAELFVTNPEELLAAYKKAQENKK